MENQDETPAQLIHRQLANGATLTIRDQSRPVAGDRWLVEIVCQVKIPVTEKMWAALDQKEAVPAGLKESFSSPLVHAMTKSRHFVDLADKPTVLAELIRQVEEHILAYLANANFPQRLFEQHYTEAREKYLLGEQMTQAAEGGDRDRVEDEGPADFSNCFNSSELKV